MSENKPPEGGTPGPRPAQKPASMARYKRELRKEIRRRAHDPEVNFLNITAMMDMMVIILVFLLKSLSSSSASVPDSDDLRVPKSILTTEPTQEGVPVMISRSSIVVDGDPVVPVPADASHGVEARYKRAGANDLYISRLATKLQSWRDKDLKVKAATGKADLRSEAIIIADKRTPYRLLVEVLFTLGQTEFSRFHLMVMQGAKDMSP